MERLVVNKIENGYIVELTVLEIAKDPNGFMQRRPVTTPFYVPDVRALIAKINPDASEPQEAIIVEAK